MNKLKNQDTGDKKRKSNIELLRIFSMIMIVAHHFVVHGNFIFNMVPLTQTIWLQFLSSVGNIGVNIFVMISGYFLISSEKVKIEKVIKLFIQILFYSISIYTIFIIFKPELFNITGLIKHLLGYPIWWFAKSYLALYLIHPYINQLLKKYDKKEYLKLILFLTVIICIIPTLTTQEFDEGSLVWFIYVYIIGGYLKKYPLKLECRSINYLKISFSIYSIFFLSIIFFDFIGINFYINSEYIPYFFALSKMPTLVISLFIFLGFLKLKIGYCKYINIISSSTFGIYLIHEHDFARKMLWNFFGQSKYSNAFMLIPYSIIVIIIVFVLCSVIELLRIYILEKRYIILIDKLSIKINKIIKKICDLKILN